MTDDEIREIAIEHGFTLREQPDWSTDLNPYVYSFARELLARERERCANACDVRGNMEAQNGRIEGANAARLCLAAIRAMEAQ